MRAALRRARGGAPPAPLARAPPLARALHASRALAQAKKDPYGVLGLARGADKDEVKKSYYKLVKKCGPRRARARARACARQRARATSRLPPSRARAPQVPPRPEQGRQERGGQVPRGAGGVRCALGRRQARGL